MVRTGGDVEMPRPTGGVTLLLVGKIGNGKSATGNSILGRDAFASRRSYGCVTQACQKASTTLDDGRVVHLIDTPGLFDIGGATAEDDDGLEALECMSMAKDGIHAVLVVLSAASRFSPQDASAIQLMQMFFGERVVLAFTHGDEVQEDEFRDMLSNAPEYMLELVRLCRGRVVLLDNRTRDTRIQAGQREELLDKVDSIMINHQGQPFSGQMRPQIKEEEEEMHDLNGHSEIQKSRVKNEVCKPWYIQTYEYLAYAAGAVWNKICCLWRKVIDIVRGRVETTKKQIINEVVSRGSTVQRRMMRPRMMTGYR